MRIAARLQSKIKNDILVFLPMATYSRPRLDQPRFLRFHVSRNGLTCPGMRENQA